MLDRLIFLNLTGFSADFFSRLIDFADKIGKKLAVVGAPNGNTMQRVEVLNVKPDEAIRKFNPYAFVLKKEKLSPFELLFFKPPYEELVEEVNTKNFFLFDEKFQIPRKVLIYVDIDGWTKDYADFLNDFLKRLDATACVATVIDESDDIFPLIEKEFPETVLTDLLEHFAAKRLESFRKLLGNVENLSFVVLKGEAGTVVPHYAVKMGYDLLTVPQNDPHKEEFLEDSPLSLALIYSLAEEKNG